jgi:hypothetical protein
LFLERVLQRALEEAESRKKLEAHSVAVEEKPAALESSGGAGDRKREWTNEILQRNKRHAVEVIEKDGCGHADMLRKL